MICIKIYLQFDVLHIHVQKQGNLLHSSFLVKYYFYHYHYDNNNYYYCYHIQYSVQTTKKEILSFTRMKYSLELEPTLYAMLQY